MFFSPCMTFDAVKITEPGPITAVLPSVVTSTLPSRIMTNSEWGWRCGGCGICPAGSVVS